MSDDDDLDDALADDSYGEGRGRGNLNLSHYEQEREDEEGNGEGDGEGDGYDDDEDFEPYEQEIKLRQSPIIKPKSQQDIDEDIFGDDDEQEEDGRQGDGEPVTSQEDSQIDFEEHAMTLESYMEEFFKKKYQEHPDGHSPEAVDPQVGSFFSFFSSQKGNRV